MRRALALILASASTLLLAPHASGARRHFLVDPAGDQLVPLSAYDIRTLDLSTTGVTRHGQYVPTTLVASVDLGAAPTLPGMSVEVGAKLSSCPGALLTLRYQAPRGTTLTQGVQVFKQYDVNIDPCFDGEGASAGRGTDTTARIVVRGTTVTWQVPLKPLAPKLVPGSVLSSVEVATYQDEPMTGTYTTDGFYSGALPPGIDAASAEREFRVR